MSLDRHRAFLQHDKQVSDRDGGLHDVLRDLFPVRCNEPKNTSLECTHFELTPVDGEPDSFALNLVCRLISYEPDGAVDNISEQATRVGLVIVDEDEAYTVTSALIGTGESAQDFAAHVTGLVTAMVGRARERIAALDADTTPASLLSAS